jgi:hypothetical protein
MELPCHPGPDSYLILIPKETDERLRVARTRLVEVLPGLVESRLVTGVEGEFWSPRKILRRILWHERDHTGHIYKLLAGG